ncbi:uncharacterized protein PV07_02352 [Cladophialophora immunda]|uniref:Aspartate/glutamate racemase family protein n=1 Tax=Cladophialophora immunda TaxID=569365 RepID=A0A0D2BDT8_9EURO|nr:uncharacterized protein PV07_02352 [Cladophialophora immunda]KIW35667.1 hypothetical protein PV07_02352 [Cladophialophora immunda]OQV04944.1 hypothetical protein CLAIMM_09754 [Cladophialophora immunda]
MSISKGQNTNAPPLGFISVDVDIERPVGDPFNEATWPFPLLKELAEGSQLNNIVTSETYPEEFLAGIVSAGEKLQQKGCVGIITDCGFLAGAQRELAMRLSIPIAASALAQIPSIQAFLRPGQTVGALTYDDSKLGVRQLLQVGVHDPDAVYIAAPPEDGWLRGHIRDGVPYDHAKIETELVESALGLLRRHPDIGAILLECTQMPPFADAIRKATNLPVYDVYTLGTWFYSALTSQRPQHWGPI